MYEEIIQHYLSKICTSDAYKSDERCSDPDLLFPDFKAMIDKAITEYNRREITTPIFFETYRSDARQIECYNSGSSDTRTKGMHHFGIAVDIITKKKNGNWDWNGLKYSCLRSIAGGLGLTLLDMEDCHIQLIPKSKQVTLRRAVLEGVRDFQREHGLKPDGIVGPKTTEALKIAFVPGYVPKTDNI